MEIKEDLEVKIPKRGLHFQRSGFAIYPRYKHHKKNMVELSIIFGPQDDVKNLPKMVHSSKNPEGIKVENRKSCSDAPPCALNLEFFVKALKQEPGDLSTASMRI